MDGSTLTRPDSSGKSMKNNRRELLTAEEDREEDEVDDTKTEECDMEVWNTFSKNFHQVQSILEQNRSLIQQANENHQSRISDNLVKNVSLIREINGNISRVISIYSDLSANFFNAIQQRRARAEPKMNRDDGGGRTGKTGDVDNRNEDNLSQMIAARRFNDFLPQK